MSVKFIHRRYVTKATLEDKLAGKQFSVSGKGGVTVAYYWAADQSKVLIGVARCHQDENFNKRVARDIAMGRLYSNKKNRHTELDLLGLKNLTPKSIHDIVDGWLENQERLWDMDITNCKAN